MLSLPTYANYYCSGRVHYLGVASNDILSLSNGYGVHNACNLNDEHCKAWLSFATAAKIADRNIQIYYSSTSINGNNPDACRNIGNWVTPSDSIYHIAIQ